MPVNMIKKGIKNINIAEPRHRSKKGTRLYKTLVIYISKSQLLLGVVYDFYREYSERSF